MADLLAQTHLNDEQQHMLKTIRESGNALITVINDILDFSKIEAGRMEIEDVSMSIAHALEGVAGTLTPNATKKGIRIHTFVDPVIPHAVHGDPVRVRQILFNLTGNAVKFSDKKDVAVSAKPIAGDDDGLLWVRFEVRDRGIGISVENQTKLFQAFSQAESSTTRKFGGTGLGLAICKRLTGLMDGRIGVESEEGTGSTFWVEIPFKVAAGARTTEKARDLQDVKVLIVASPPPRETALVAYLSCWGADSVFVDSASRAIEAINKAHRDGQAYQVIVIDCGLDAEQQDEALRAIRASGVVKETAARLILLQDFQHRGARIQDKDLVTLDANPLVRYRFITAIAVATGRASPEVKKDEDVFKIGAVKAPTVDEARAQGRLILLAEDNLTNQDVIRRQLNLLGYACEIAGNGVLALEAWNATDYAALLTDCHMPEMDGYELTAVIRQAEKDSGRRKPIIAITANALQGEAERCLAAGMDDYLSKPVALPALNAMLKKWMPGQAGESAFIGAMPSTPPAAHRPRAVPVNDRAIKDMFGDDDDTFKEIVQGFLGPSHEIVGDIVVAADARRTEDVRDGAHKLKSSARSIGADALADICASLEDAGRGSHWEQIETLVPALRAQMEAVTAYIENL